MVKPKEGLLVDGMGLLGLPAAFMAVAATAAAVFPAAAHATSLFLAADHIPCSQQDNSQQDCTDDIGCHTKASFADT